MSVHRITLSEQTPIEVGSCVAITGDEAHHAARVKRLAVGEGIELLNGEGGVYVSRVEALEKQGKGWMLVARVEELIQQGEPVPWLEACVAPPKGTRLESMVDMISQVGVASFRPLEARRTISDPRPGKLDRVRRVAMESAKQCGRAWTMRIGRPVLFKDALVQDDATTVVIADGSGSEYEPSGAERIRVLIGPEGGFTENELERAREAGARVARFGEHVLRIETAAVVACACVLSAERSTTARGQSLAGTSLGTAAQERP